MLKDYIEISKGFQSSVNIEYDFNDASKIDGFIPTTSALEIITNILINTDADQLQRAKILTGAYGRGKSHIILVALCILINKNKALFKEMLGKVKNKDLNAYKIINNYITSKKRMLPIIINGSSNNLTQSFLNALQQALKLYGIEDIMPDTHFQAAIQIIELWKKNYPDTYDAFEMNINGSADSFIAKLQSNDINSYREFERLYPSLTSGSVFNPFVGLNVVDVFDKVNIAIKDKGYSGLYIVYDEFGKYLESSISVADESETKLLQNLAEKCNRNASQQMHLMLICHKDISNYIDMNLPKDKVDGWRGISGRFEHINLSNDFDQMYEIISNALIKNSESWSTFYRNHEKIFDELHEVFDQDLGMNGTPFVVDCYPLHPVTTFALPRLSEKIAQNERTLFTFLTANQKNTLREIVQYDESENFRIITPDYIYDYFQKELKKELSSTEIHKTYTLSATVLKKVEEDSLASRIIKTIAVIYFIQEFDHLPPTADTICNIYSTEYDKKVIINIIESLIEEKYIVYLNNSNSYLRLKETSGVNVSQKIAEKTNSLLDKYNYQEALNLCADSNYLYPIRHNNEKCITRYFNLEFISYQNFMSKTDFEIKEGASGTVFAIFFETIDEFENMSYEHIEHCLECRCVFIFPKQYKNILASVYTYLAAKELLEECSDEEEVLKSEYAIYIDDHETVVSDFVSDYLRPEMNRAIYYQHFERHNITRRAQLTELLSVICDHAFLHTPIINNETLNKDKLTGVAITSRTKLTTALLESSFIEENLGLAGSGQDVSFMRSTLIQTGILISDSGNYSITLEPTDESIAYILDVILRFFTRTVQFGESTFQVLYDSLTNPREGIGMKRGSIPVFIAVVLNKVKKDLVFKCNGNEIKINSDALNSINEKPGNYSVVMENWDEGKSQYLTSLAELFSDSVSDNEKSYNGFTYISNAMNRWYLNLPKCAREMTKRYSDGKVLENERIKLISALKQQSSNSRELLFETIPKIFGVKEITGSLADNIQISKKIFDDAKYSLMKYVINKIRTVFKCGKQASLSSGLQEWYYSLKAVTVQHLFPNNENLILQLIVTAGNDENTLAERMGKALVGLRIDDWNNTVADSFSAKLLAFKETIERYDKDNHIQEYSKGSTYKIVFVDDNGAEKERSFEKVAYSRNATLLYQDITGAIEEIGASVTEQEKRQVLMDILSKLCN